MSVSSVAMLQNRHQVDLSPLLEGWLVHPQLERIMFTSYSRYKNILFANDVYMFTGVCSDDVPFIQGIKNKPCINVISK